MPLRFFLFFFFDFWQFHYSVFWRFFCIEIIGCPVSFLDFYIQFPPQAWEILSYYFFKYTLSAPLSLSAPGRPLFLYLFSHQYMRVLVGFLHFLKILVLSPPESFLNFYPPSCRFFPRSHLPYFLSFLYILDLIHWILQLQNLSGSF